MGWAVFGVLGAGEGYYSVVGLISGRRRPCSHGGRWSIQVRLAGGASGCEVKLSLRRRSVWGDRRRVSRQPCTFHYTSSPIFRDFGVWLTCSGVRRAGHLSGSAKGSLVPLSTGVGPAAWEGGRMQRPVGSSRLERQYRGDATFGWPDHS